MKYPSGRELATGYDGLGRAVSASPAAGGTAYATVTAFAPHGAPQSLTMGNGLVETTVFNARLQARQQTVMKGSALKLRICLGFDGSVGAPTDTCGDAGASANNGNVWRRRIQDGAATFDQSFAYDGVNRLSKMTEGSTVVESYEFDAMGNIGFTGGTAAHGNQTPGSVSSYSGNRWTGLGVDYDGAGNVKALPDRSFTWDGENRLTGSVQPGFGGGISYSYDGEGRRVLRQVGTRKTVFVYDAQDHLGSTRLVTNAAGLDVERRFSGRRLCERGCDGC